MTTGCAGGRLRGSVVTEVHSSKGVCGVVDPLLAGGGVGRFAEEAFVEGFAGTDASGYCGFDSADMFWIIMVEGGMGLGSSV